MDQHSAAADASADVIIAGAGMPGATLALALKGAGLNPVLIDPQPFAAQLAPSFDGRASAIAAASFRQWRALGVAAALEPHAEPIRQILVTDGRAPGAAARKGGLLASAYLRFDPEERGDGAAGRPGGEPLGYMLENRRIRHALAAAVEAAGVPVLAPAAVTEVETGPAAATVTLADGRRLSASLVVGAEGRGSVVRQAAGIEVTGWPYRQTGVVATVALERPHHGVAYEHFLPSGPFAILPLTATRASLVWTEAADRGAALAQASDAAFAAHLQRRFGPFLGRVEVVGPRFTYPLALSIANRLTGPRTALLGDAAVAIHPIAGQGLNLGLKASAALAEVIVDAARLGEDIGAEATLARYARWRRFDNAALALATDAFTRLFSTDLAPVRAARALGLAAVNRIGPARRFFMREAGGATGDRPRLLQGLPL